MFSKSRNSWTTAVAVPVVLAGGMACGSIWAAEPAQISGGDAPKSASSADSGKIREGRGALDFYAGSAGGQEEALRLSSQRLQYPAADAVRPRPLLELGEPFLGNGPIRPGITLPTGQTIQPWFLLYGSLRSALQTFDDGQRHTAEWANRLDLNGNFNLSGTERLVFSMRPLDSQAGRFTGYDFDTSSDTHSGWHEDFNARLTRLYFEGDLGQIFPGLDPDDTRPFDFGFSVGRQRIALQDGMLLNDLIDTVGITRNSLIFPGVSNLRISGLYGWNNFHRGNNDIPFRTTAHAGHLFGLSAEADTALGNTALLDVLYLRDDRDGNAWYLGASSTQRFGTLNSTFRVNASIPEHRQSDRVGRGVLLLSQLSKTLEGSDNLLYFNAFYDIGRFTSASRTPDVGGPLGNIGILYGPVGMGRYGVPLGRASDDTIGASLGYQMFLGGIDRQLIFELGGRTSTARGGEGQVGFGARFQQTIGERHVLRLDGFAGGREGDGFGYGLRTEWMIKF